jgi:hypothetical protein
LKTYTVDNSPEMISLVLEGDELSLVIGDHILRDDGYLDRGFLQSWFWGDSLR